MKCACCVDDSIFTRFNNLIKYHHKFLIIIVIFNNIGFTRSFWLFSFLAIFLSLKFVLQLITLILYVSFFLIVITNFFFVPGLGSIFPSTTKISFLRFSSNQQTLHPPLDSQKSPITTYKLFLSRINHKLRLGESISTIEHGVSKS